jgi:hypothetical protein
MSEMNIPDWVDRRTIEWALAVCEHVDAMALQRADARFYRHGIAACRAQFRAAGDHRYTDREVNRVIPRDVILLVLIGTVAGVMFGCALGSGLIYVHVVFR